MHCFFFKFLVLASDSSGSVVVTKSHTITIDRPSQPLQVSCPIVAEPNIPYKCGFANMPGSGDGAKQGHVIVRRVAKKVRPGRAFREPALLRFVRKFQIEIIRAIRVC